MVMPVFAATQPAWEVDQGKWRYKDGDGQYKKSTWLRDPNDHRLYHLDADGVMDTGWKLMDGIWYFLVNEHTGYYGAALEKTWAWIDGYCYYFGEDGKMAASCTTADGFTVDTDGRWTENGKPVYISGQRRKRFQRFFQKQKERKYKRERRDVSLYGPLCHRWRGHLGFL